MQGNSKFLIGTGNRGKFAEISTILSTLPFEILSPEDLGVSHEGLEETGDTYEENAIIKVKHYQDGSGLNLVMAEDSGLVVEALKDELGVNTRRWGAGADASDQEWIDYFLERMEGEENRRASFICNAALYHNGDIYIFKGEVPGIITADLEAPILPGLPLSSCFKADGSDAVYAALSKDQKARISHRAWAVGQVRDFLADQAV